MTLAPLSWNASWLTPPPESPPSTGSPTEAPWWPAEIHVNPTELGTIPAPEEPASLATSVQGRRVLVMGSGSGTNFEALVHALRPLGVVVAGVFCDKPGAGLLLRAQRLGVPSTLPTEEERASRRSLNDAVLAFLAQPFDLLLLAGYMRILPPRVVEPHQGVIVNIHPSLLPDFPGLRAMEQAWEARAVRAGVTVHLVDCGVDTGPILAQAGLNLRTCDSLAQLKAQLHALEHRLYPWTVLHLLAHRASQTGAPL